MAARPRAGRGMAGLDGSKDVDLEADLHARELHARVLEGVKKAKEHNENAARTGQEALELKEKIDAQEGGSKYAIQPSASPGHNSSLLLPVPLAGKDQPHSGLLLDYHPIHI